MDSHVYGLVEVGSTDSLKKAQKAACKQLPAALNFVKERWGVFGGGANQPLIVTIVVLTNLSANSLEEATAVLKKSPIGMQNIPITVFGKRECENVDNFSSALTSFLGEHKSERSDHTSRVLVSFP